MKTRTVWRRLVGYDVILRDRDEWKRRALAAEAEVKQLEQRLSDEYWRGRDDERRGGYEF